MTRRLGWALALGWLAVTTGTGCGGEGGGDEEEAPECVPGGPFGNVCERPVDPALRDAGGSGTAGEDPPATASDASTDERPSPPADPGLQPLPDPPACELPPPADCAENVHTGDVFARTQAEIDALEGVTTIDGDLEIRSSDATSLDALRCLVAVEGDLTIERNRELLSLDGLQNLVTIAHGMDLLDNEQADIGCGFQRLVEVGTTSLTPSIDIERTGLTALRLPALVSSGHLRIENNPQLVVIEGASAMESLGQFWITDNDSLSRVSGFEGLRSVSDLRISDNPRLSQCDALLILDRLVKQGFTALAEIGGNLEPCP